MTTIEDTHLDHDLDTGPVLDRPGLRPVPDEPVIDVRLVDRFLTVLEDASPAEVLAQFPANPASPSTKSQEAKDRIRSFAQFSDHVLRPALIHEPTAVRVVALAGRLIDHLNGLDPKRVKPVEGEGSGDKPQPLAVSGWVVELTSWIDRAAAVGATDDALVDRLFEAYSRRIATDGLPGLFGDGLDHYITHRDAEVGA